MIYRLLTIFFFLSSTASAQIFIVDKASVEKAQKERSAGLVLTVHGKATNVSSEKDGQLSLYVRLCGFIIIPKNQKGEAPKPGQSISATLKERCKIADWE
jgi:hypothetical protein